MRSTTPHLEEQLVHVDGVRVTRQVDDGPLLNSVSANQRRHLHSKRSSRKGSNAGTGLLVGLALSLSCLAPSVSTSTAN
jgi:hypothetical protein